MDWQRVPTLNNGVHAEALRMPLQSLFPFAGIPWGQRGLLDTVSATRLLSLLNVRYTTKCSYLEQT
jgi:hypothetical protein